MPSKQSKSKDGIKRRRPRPNRVNGDATRGRILDAAELLFAQHGYTAVSMRSITAQAGVNVAAIHFHFASKEALFEAIFDRRIEPINAQRTAALEKLLAGGTGATFAIEDVIEAFVRPHLQMAEGFDAGRIIVLQFMARAAAEQDPNIQGVLRKQFDPPWHLLVQASMRTLPGISEEKISWGLFFLLGSLYFINPNRQWLASLTNDRCSASDTETASEHLVPFLAGGLRALLNAELPRGKKRRRPRAHSP